MEPAPGSEFERRAERGGSVAWTIAAVLTVVACIVFLASGGGKSAPPAAPEKPQPRATPEKPQKQQASPPPDSAAKSKSGKTLKPVKPSELEAARKRLDELARTYLPQAPAYREQLARVQALEIIERNHADEPRELKKARVELAVAIARGLGQGHPKVIELNTRIEKLEANVKRDK